MKMKKILAMLLSAAMCVSAFSVAVFADASEDYEAPDLLSEDNERAGTMTLAAEEESVATWEDIADTSWYNDTDTEFTIDTPEKLAGIGVILKQKIVLDKGEDTESEEDDTIEAFQGKTIKLGDDIDLSGRQFLPIGGVHLGVAFEGTFNGQNNTISNMYQNGWDLGFSFGQSAGMGLFGWVWDAEIKNLKIDNSEITMEAVVMGNVAGYAGGECTFENITITNSIIANYNWDTGGIVGQAYSAPEETPQVYRDINIDDTNLIAAHWGTWDASLGGVIGRTTESAYVKLIKCNIAAEFDVYNDVVAAYQWYAYRYSGMLVGYTKAVSTDENGRTRAISDRIYCEDCTVTYGDWANYTYCQFPNVAPQFVREQGGYSTDPYYSGRRWTAAVDANGNNVVSEDHVHGEGEQHRVMCVFNQLFGGGQGVYGNPVHEGPCPEGVENGGVTIIDNALPARSAAKIVSNGEPEYYETITAAIEAAENEETIIVTRDITTEAITVSGKELTIDLAENTLTITTQNNFNTDADVTFKNGDICITGAVSNADALFCVGNYSTNATVTLDGVDVYGDGYSSAYAVFYVYNDSELNIDGGSVVVANDNAAAGGVFKAEEAAKGKINITGTESDPTELAFTNAKIGFLDGTVVMDFVNLDIVGGANAINQSALTVKNSDLTISGCDGRALTLSQGNVVIENSNLNFSDCSEGEIRFKKSLALTADENSTISLCSAYADESATGATINGELVINDENNPDFVVVDDEKYIVANGDITYGCYNVGTTGEAGTDSYRERIQVDIYNAKAKESLVVKLYSGETLLSETSRRATDRDDENASLFPVNGTTTAAIIISGRLSGSWETDWKAKPSAALIPDKIELYADGILVDTFEPAFDDEDTAAYKALGGVSSGEISYAGQVITRGTPDDEKFRERVGVGLKNLKAKEEVKIELYSGDTLLSVTKLRESDRDDENVKLFPAVGKDEFTVNIVVCGEQSGSWDTEWKVAPSVVYIPDSIKLYVDGILTDELDKGFLGGNEEKYIALTGVYAPVKIGEAKYPTIEAAVAAAVDGDTITVVQNEIAGTGTNGRAITISKDITLDLGGNTLTDAYIIVTGEVEITNGYIVNTNEPYPLVVQNGGELDITDVEIRASKSDRAVWVRDNSTLNLKAGADIIATKGEGNTKTNLIAGVYTDKNTTVNVNGGTITVDTPDNKAVGIFGNYTGANVKMTAGKISTSGKNYSYGINVDGDITVSGGEIVTNEKGYSYSSGIRYGNNYALVTALGDVTITGGKITTNGYSGYMVNVGRSYNSNDQTVTITDVEFRNNLSEIDKTVGGHKAPVLIWEGSASDVTANITGGDFYGVNANLLRDDGDAVLSVSGGIFETKPEEKYLADSYTTVKLADGRYAVLTKDYSPTEIAVVFEYVPEKETEEEIVYNINLEAQGKVINRLNSGDLTFVLTQINQGENNKYEIIDIAGDNIAVNPVDDKGRYEFHFSTKTNVENDTAKSITIAQVKFTGYGTFSFGVDANANATNAVHTTTIVDNIVDTFIPNGDGEEYGKLSIGTVFEDTIAVPKRTLEIDIEFPNAVEDQEYEYQQMTVVVSGGDLDENITFNLGTGDDTVAMNAETGAYKIVLKDTLTKNIRYNVTVSGAGYRTAYYTVQMTENKALKFWNNVKDAGKVIEYTYGEEGALFAKENADNPLTTFLAGDIVNDGLINIYDLSAVVSYFGETGLSADVHPEYAEYDLNRDGKIDSKDVAYVLVSWNN